MTVNLRCATLHSLFYLQQNDKFIDCLHVKHAQRLRQLVEGVRDSFLGALSKVSFVS